MIGIGSAIGAGLKAVGSIFGGISASKAMKKVGDNIGHQLTENQNWYDRRFNEDGTQRADAQRMITMVGDSIKKRNQQAAGTQAVMGGTDESVAAAKEANNNALADVSSKIVAQSDARKDLVEQQYLNNRSALNDQLNLLNEKNAKNISSSTNAVMNTASDIAGIL